MGSTIGRASKFAIAAVAAVGLAVPVGGAIAAPGTECPPAGGGGAYPGAACTLAVSDSSVEAGGTVTLFGSGFAAGTEFAVFFGPGANVLAQGTVPQSGEVRVEVTIPADTAPGEYTLALRGVDDDGGPRELTTTITVVGDEAGGGPGPESTGVLPDTGA